MASSKYEIISEALKEMGEEEIPLTAIPTEDPPVVLPALANVHVSARRVINSYNNVRDSLLTEYRWNFSMKRGEWPADVAPTEFGERNIYSFPDDCLEVVGVRDPQQNDRNEYADNRESYISSRNFYKIEGRSIVGNLGDPAKVYYTTNERTEAEFHPLFVTALILALANRVGYKSTGSRRNREDLEARMLRAIDQAKRSDAIETSPDYLTTWDLGWLDSEWLDSRGFGGGDGGYGGGRGRRGGYWY